MEFNNKKDWCFKMRTPQEIAELIEILVKNKNTNVKQMLLECDVNRNLITGMKKDGKMPSADKLVKIASYLNVSTEYLTGITDDPTPPNKKATPEPGEPGSGMALRRANINKNSHSGDPERDKLIQGLIERLYAETNIERLKELSDYSDYLISRRNRKD